MSTSNINTDQVLKFLSKAFHAATQRAISSRVLERDNVRGSDLYEFQVNFCYLTNDIARGPTYIVPKRITEANEMIAKIIKMAEETPA